MGVPRGARLVDGVLSPFYADSTDCQAMLEGDVTGVTVRR